MKYFVIAILLLLFDGSVANATIYRWVDAQGVVHFSDTRPASSTIDADLEVERVKLQLPKHQWQPFRVALRTFGFTLDEKQREAIDEAADSVYRFYDTILHFDFHQTVEFDISIYQDREEFEARRALEWPHDRLPDVRAVYYTHSNAIVAMRNADFQEQLNTLQHEISHAIMASFAPRSPKWLNEGIATYVSRLQWKDDALWVQRNLPYERDIKRLAASGELIPLEQYFQMANRTFNEMQHAKSAIPYTMGWGVCAYLMSNPIGRSVVIRLVHDLGRHGKFPTIDSIDDAYLGGLLTFESMWLRWIDGQHNEYVLRP